jgi:hypothetical protein
MVTAAVIAVLAAVSVLVGCRAISRSERPAALPVEPGAAADPWIGTPLQDYLATIDHPSSYELRNGASGKGTETQRRTLLKLVGGDAKTVKVIEEGRWMLIDIEAGAMYACKDGAEAIIKISAADLTGFSDPTGAAGMDGTIQRSETIDGHDCWAVQPSGVESRDEVWIDKVTGLVRQVKRLGCIHRFSYARINEVPESEFALPEGVRVIERDVFGER